jgi:DNA-binding GntR family transcriptional regulator
MPPTKVVRQAAPLRQQVVRLLREDILEGVLAPGERLLESALCDSYGVSRTVVREALRQLEAESLITIVPNRGPIVTVLTEHDIRSLYEVRRVLEGLAGELFARNASDDDAAALIAHMSEMEATYLHGTVESRGESKEKFYELLLGGAKNDVLDTNLRGVHTRIGLFRRFAFVDDQRVALSMDELRNIVREAAHNRDPGASRLACERHIELAGELAIVAYKARLTDTGAASTEPGGAAANPVGGTTTVAG